MSQQELIDAINKSLYDVSRKRLNIYTAGLVDKKKKTQVKKAKSKGPSEYNMKVKKIHMENPDILMAVVFKMAAGKSCK
jgi:hypothetical protein